MDQLQSITSCCTSKNLENALTPELMLQVTEHLVESDPASVRSLMLTSKAIHSLVTTYETSVVQSISHRYSQDLIFGNEKLSTLENPFFVTRHTYQWLEEVRSRHQTIDYLLNHELTAMLCPHHNWPTLDIPKPDLDRCLVNFKRRALLLLYRLADSAAGPPYGIAESRKRQSDFLESLPVQDLAAIGCIIEVMGQGYWNIIKTGLAEMEYKDSLLQMKNIQRPASLFIPRSIKNTSDLDSDYWIRECMCMFEHCLQKMGPTYAWAFFAGNTEPNRRMDLWARDELESALENLTAYELGRTMGYASLQSVVWAVFCTKVDCTRMDQWIHAKDIIEVELATYLPTEAPKM